MREVTFELNGTRFEASCNPSTLYAEEDFMGECEFRFEGRLAHKLASVTLEEYTRGGTRIRQTLGERMEDRATCETCKLCNGSQGRADARASIVILAHGAGAKNLNIIGV